MTAPVVEAEPVETPGPVEAADPAVDLEPVELPDEPRREAQKLRGRLRDTEAERDGLTETVTTLRRQLVEQTVAGTLPKPAALWAAGVDVADLFGEDGTLDPEKLTAAVARAATDLGIVRRGRAPAYLPQQGGSHDAPEQAATWQNLIRAQLDHVPGGNLETSPEDDARGLVSGAHDPIRTDPGRLP